MTEFKPNTSRNSTEFEIKFPLCLNQSKMFVFFELHNEKNRISIKCFIRKNSYFILLLNSF